PASGAGLLAFGAQLSGAHSGPGRQLRSRSLATHRRGGCPAADSLPAAGGTRSPAGLDGSRSPGCAGHSLPAAGALPVGAPGTAGPPRRAFDREVVVMLHGRALRWSTWLGWQIDSNWATPWLFLVY